MSDHWSEEQEFWLKSLDDLDAELAAGDLDPEDHRALADGYTRRAAEAFRAAQKSQPHTDTTPGSTPEVENRGLAMPGRFRIFGPAGGARRRWGVTVVGLVIVGVAAGVLLARSAGSRHAGDTITGNDAVTSVAGLLNNAELSFAAGDEAEALRLYDQVLERSPSNPTALAYKGWLLVLEGREDEAADVLADAVAADPDYPDARAFRTLLFTRTGDCGAAAAELVALDATNPPSIITDLIQQQSLPTRIALCRIGELAGTTELTLADLGVTAGDAVTAALVIWDPLAPTDGDPLLALRVYEAVLGEVPDHPAALTHSGVLLIQTGQEAEGERRITQAVEVAPNDAEARLWRAWLYLGLNQTDQALLDLDVLDTLNPPPNVALLAQDLRSQLRDSTT